jgi:hypothetical protein
MVSINPLNWFKSKRTNEIKFEFEKIGMVLVVHVPVGNLPAQKVQEYLKAHHDTLSPSKKEFGVEKILVVPKR